MIIKKTPTRDQVAPSCGIKFMYKYNDKIKLFFVLLKYIIFVAVLIISRL